MNSAIDIPMAALNGKSMDYIKFEIEGDAVLGDLRFMKITSGMLNESNVNTLLRSPNMKVLKAGVKALETMVLAHYKSGIDITAKEYSRGVIETYLSFSSLSV